VKDTTLRNRIKGWLCGWPWLLAALLCLFGLVIVVSWYMGEGTFVLTTGEIIKITDTEMATYNGTSTICTPTIRFFTRQEQAIEFSQTTTSSDDCNRQVGDVVNVAYHADNPEEAQVIPSGGPWLGYLSPLIIGGVSCLVLFVVFVKRAIASKL
jgi:Protein of unknown function (DUF3592)